MPLLLVVVCCCCCRQAWRQLCAHLNCGGMRKDWLTHVGSTCSAWNVEMCSKRLRGA